MSSASAADPPVAVGADAPPDWVPGAAIAVLIAAVAYNVPLAILNNFAGGVGRGALIAVETVLIGAALVLAGLRWRPDMTRWAAMIVVFALLSIMLSLGRQTFDPKPFRDTLMIATFIMLGMIVPRDRARRAFAGLQIAVAVVLIFELFAPTVWASLVNTRDYVISTRGFSEDIFFGDLELFGASRPDDRYFLPWTGWIRASSIFLEPLSLGNFASFGMLAILFFWRDWRWRTRALMVAIWALVLVGSDGRSALTSSLIVLALAPLFVRLPALLAAFYLPVVVLAVRLFSTMLEWNPLEDTFPGRLARGMKHLFRLDEHELAGFSLPGPLLADSGVAYFVVGQSLLGVLMFQLFVYFQPALRGRDQRLMLHGAATLFAMSILISISMLSIKTAALIWFFAGVAFAGTAAETRRPAGIAAGGPRSSFVGRAQPL